MLVEPCQPTHKGVKMTEENIETETETETETEEEPKLTVLTDADLSKEVYGTFEGFKFICPVCKKPSVMVNPDMSTRCTTLGCGEEFFIQSNIVVSYAKKLLALHKKAEETKEVK